MSFRYLPARGRTVAAVRQRVFSTRLGLKAVELARPLMSRSGDGAGYPRALMAKSSFETKHGLPGRAGRRDPSSSVAPIALLCGLPAS